MKKLLWIGVVVVSIFVYVILLKPMGQSVEKTITTAVLPSPSMGNDLVVPIQTATTAVTISSLTLSAPGFLAVRTVEGGRLGQIVEISKYLSVGEHSNITIDLGEFYEGGKELLVMVYTDDGNDKVFNDLDQPLLVGGIPLARYVATGLPVPANIANNNQNANAMHTMGTTTMATVRYADTGFEPKELSVPVGTVVMFVNESNTGMWVASNEHPGHSILPTFDQFKTSPPGTTYMYTFDAKGVWVYHDHIKPSLVGQVEVI